MMQAMMAAAARRAWVVVALVFVSTVSGGVSVGCRSCANIALDGLNVTVVDGATGSPICDATVTAQDGDHVETLMQGGCRYGGAYERPGTYTLTATSGSRSEVVMDVRVLGNGDDFCPHVVTETATITLDP
jgi:hypothetical protein